MILSVAIKGHWHRLYDYLPPDAFNHELMPGMRLLLPFHNKQLIGILIEVKTTTSVPLYKLKRTIRILDETPLFSEELYKLCLFAAEYYHTSLGEILLSALPKRMKSIVSLKSIKTKISKKLLTEKIVEQKKSLLLNHEQTEAVNTILNKKKEFSVFLLEGVTGSGKTEVYLNLIPNILRQQQQVLILVPEIGLAPQTAYRFNEIYPNQVISVHSGMTDQKRYLAWQSIRMGEVSIVIGTRSAVFAPFKSLGLIIVDEEHDGSFKQEDRFCYHARDLAIVRAKNNSISIVLGSATPSLESLWNAKQKRCHHIKLTQRAGNASFPICKLIDVSNELMPYGVSAVMKQAIKRHLNNKRQVLLFLNRRGFAPVLFCSNCQWIAECSRCDANLVFHKKIKKLCCHYCNAQKPLPLTCPNCKANQWQFIGVGTQRVEELLQKEFPNIPVFRLDRDNTRQNNQLIQLLSDIHATESAILLGTQMLAKGHHFPKVTFVGILDGDAGLLSADFRAAEYAGQLITQVSGRAGREDELGEVLIQTRQPNHPHLTTLLQQGYIAFAESLLLDRQQLGWPPLTFLAILRAESYDISMAKTFLLNIKNLLNIPKEIELFGPTESWLVKKKGYFNLQLLFRSPARKLLQLFLHDLTRILIDLPEAAKIRWRIDVDPLQVCRS